MDVNEELMFLGKGWVGGWGRGGVGLVGGGQGGCERRIIEVFVKIQKKNWGGGGSGGWGGGGGGGLGSGWGSGWM